MQKNLGSPHNPELCAYNTFQKPTAPLYTAGPISCTATPFCFSFYTFYK